MSKRSVFVLGADEFNFERLRSLPDADAYEFHPLFTFEQVQGPHRYPLNQLIDLATESLEAYPHRIAGILGYWDLPVSALVPLLAARFGLPAAPLEGVIASEHKYWSRLLQRTAAPQCVPEFRLVDPFAGDRFPKIDLTYPYWIKPVKSFQSHLGFRVDSDEELARATCEIRAGIGRMAEPFNRLLERVDLPAEVAHVTGYHCVAERLIAGHQCTAEGYVVNGEVEVHGIIDSLRYENVSSFLRYEYPSLLPPTIQQRVRDATGRIIHALGLDHTAFNIEFFWDEPTDRLWVIEVNPRISQSHSDLFEKVDGVSNHKVVLDLAVGNEPQWETGKGPFRCAAKWFLRVFEDGRVTRAPTEQDLARISEQMPGTVVKPQVRYGQRLSEIPDEDSYSYTLAQIFLGGDSRDELVEKYRRCVEALPYEVDHEPAARLQPAG